MNKFSLLAGAIVRLGCYWGIIATLIHLVYKLSPTHGNIILVLLVMHLIASQIVLLGLKNLKQ